MFLSKTYVPALRNSGKTQNKKKKKKKKKKPIHTRKSRRMMDE